MTTVTKINSPPVIKIDLQLKLWELAALGGALAVFGLMSWCLLTDFSLRRVFWPGSGEGSLAKPIGKVTYTLNKTLRQARDQPEFMTLAQEDAVYPLDTIMAGPGSAIRITLNDNTVVEVSENSMIRLNFDSRLRLSGIDRETFVEVVTGTAAAKGSGKSTLTIRSQDKVFTATQEKSMEISRQGTHVATQVAPVVNIVDQVKRARETREIQEKEKEREKVKILTEAKQAFSKLGGVMTPSLSNKVITLSDMASDLKKLGRRGGGALPDSDERLRPKVDFASAKRVTDEMMKAPSAGILPPKIRIEIAKATQISPVDNFSIKTKASAVDFEFPLHLGWRANPENSNYVVRFSQKGRPDETFQVKADGDKAYFTYPLKRPGDYTWKIEDTGGAVLSLRNVHLNSNFEGIQLSDPILIGRDRGSQMWAAQDKWGFLFKWKPVKGVKQYKVKIARNLKAEGAADGAVVSERMILENEFVLPFKKDWQAERMFFSVEAENDAGFHLASNHVPFIFTFLPPKPRSPSNGKTMERTRLTEGMVNVTWEVDSTLDQFTLEIATDPMFRKKITTEHTSSHDFRFYPDGPGHFYWHVRGDKDTLSSPYSETSDFIIK